MRLARDGSHGAALLCVRDLDQRGLRCGVSLVSVGRGGFGDHNSRLKLLRLGLCGARALLLRRFGLGRERLRWRRRLERSELCNEVVDGPGFRRAV